MIFRTSTPARAAAAFAMLATLTLAGGGAALAGQGDVSVAVKDFDFHPMDVTVPVGASVTWKNLDGEPHTITAIDGSFRSAALDQNDSFTFRFIRRGVYRYLCTIHPRMVATVTVK